ncbi:hypothetical protein [Streptomyces chrestomyceticus]|uniref:hypothetical protein n=1 Tax=Streptomyces chrestomyceticus TaxID=68185 RepID=UPI00340D5304
MTTMFNPRVILAKETDVLVNPDLWEQNANLSARLHQVSWELDMLKREMAEAMDGEIELIRMMWDVADQREIAALVAAAHRVEAEEWKRKYEELRLS